MTDSLSFFKRAHEEGSGRLKYFLSKLTRLLAIFSFRYSMLHFLQLSIRKMPAMWSALSVAREASLHGCATILSPAFACDQQLEFQSFLDWTFDFVDMFTCAIFFFVFVCEAFCFLLPTAAPPQPTVCLQFDALDGAGWRVSLPVSSREHPGLPALSRWHRFAASPSSYLLWPPGGRMSLCSCQLPHRQWRGVSWMNEGAQGVWQWSWKGFV